MSSTGAGLAPATVGARLKTMAENLLTLEVNTIISPHIEAEKMPPPEHALIDIANEYRTWLSNRHGRKDMWAETDVSEASRSVFLRIRKAASEVLKLDSKAAGSDLNLLERMRTNSDQFISIFMRLEPAGSAPLVLQRSEGLRPQPIELLPEELVVVRKTWELMLDEVMMQTTIQIDGDVVTRVRRGLITDPDGPTIMKIHDKSVTTSTAFWSKLVDTLGSAIKGLAQLFVSAG